MASLKRQEVVGNYLKTTEGQGLAITSAHRREMVCLIERMHNLKEYRLETLYLAVNIADRYLSRIN